MGNPPGVLIGFRDLEPVVLGTLLVDLLFLVLGDGDLYLPELFIVELDVEADGFAVLAVHLQHSALPRGLRRALLPVAEHDDVAPDLAISRFDVLLHWVGTAGAKFPDVLLVVLVPADDTDFPDAR